MMPNDMDEIFQTLHEMECIYDEPLEVLEYMEIEYLLSEYNDQELLRMAIFGSIVNIRLHSISFSRVFRESMFENLVLYESPNDYELWVVVYALLMDKKNRNPILSAWYLSRFLDKVVDILTSKSLYIRELYDVFRRFPNVRMLCVDSAMKLLYRDIKL